MDTFKVTKITKSDNPNELILFVMSWTGVCQEMVDIIKRAFEVDPTAQSLTIEKDGGPTRFEWDVGPDEIKAIRI